MDLIILNVRTMFRKYMQDGIFPMNFLRRFAFHFLISSQQGESILYKLTGL